MQLFNQLLINATLSAMIERYSQPEMAQVWKQETKFQKWLDVEIAACLAHVKLGNITQEDYDTIKKKADFNVERINEIESEIHHDVIAFLTCVAEYVGPSSRFVHMGLTSSDVVDTAFSLLIRDAGNILLKNVDTLMEALQKQAEAYKYTLIMGRTHGVHAEPTTVGLKFTVWYAEWQRNRKRLQDAIDECNVGKISGAVGSYAQLPPDVEATVCEELGLDVSPASTQTLQRDRHAQFITTLAILGGTLEKMATEIRALQKTEFNEILEPFSSKQKGSSAIPHKKNPILCERITGLARVLRGYSQTSIENMALWHERDISHSGAERVIFPDATGFLNYMFHLMTKVISGMRVNEDAMIENIRRSQHVFFSQQVLLGLVNKGMLREDAYRIVQRNAHAAFDEKVMFEDKIKADPEVTKLISESELDALFVFDKYTNHVDTIFERVYN